MKTLPDLINIMTIEFLGCMIFHFVGSVSPTPIANGMILIPLVYFTSRISSAHLNPVVSIIFTLLGHINPIEMLFYWISQIFGAAIGALWTKALIPSEYGRLYRGCFIPDKLLSYAQIFGWEAVGTFSFVLPIFAVVWYTKSKNGYGNVGPIIIGLSLFANALAVGPWTGAAFNPARVLGSAIVFNCQNDNVLFYYIIGEVTGALCALIAIIPWYGINIQSWYIHKVPDQLKKNVRMIELKQELLEGEV
jgi:glycerol uptake facilitator-like aquaporin